MKAQLIKISDNAKAVEEGISKPTEEVKVDIKKQRRCKWLRGILKVLMVVNCTFLLISILYLFWGMVEEFRAKVQSRKDMIESVTFGQLDPGSIEFQVIGEQNFIWDNEESKNNVVSELLELERDTKEKFAEHIGRLLKLMSASFDGIGISPFVQMVGSGNDLEFSENSEEIENWLPSGQGLVARVFTESVQTTQPDIETPFAEEWNDGRGSFLNELSSGRIVRSVKTNEDENGCNLKFSLKVNLTDVDAAKRDNIKQINLNVEPLKIIKGQRDEENNTRDSTVKNTECAFQVTYKHFK